MSQKHIVIVGAGVIGLTNAFELRERGYRVTILARDLPQDTYTRTFASPWAGANWRSFATLQDTAAQRRDEITFRKWQQIEPKLPEEVMATVPFIDISATKLEAKDVWFSNLVSDFEVVKDRDADGFAVKYKSFTISVPLYTRWLVSEITSSNPQILDTRNAGPPVILQRCATLASLSTARSLVPGSQLVVNATGLGAADLSDVKDKDVHPVQGQTVLVSVPAFKAPLQAARCVMKVGTISSYVIPRARSGQVILGGTYDARNTSIEPNQQTAQRILRECAQLVPEIVPEGKSWTDIPIISHNLGSRPARENGARVELEMIKSLPVVHSYGIGPAGYQASFGIAHEVAHLVDSHFSQSSAHL